MSTIHFSKPAAHVALLEIDNPPMNALGRAARAALLTRLDEIDADAAIRSVVLTGRGRAFCGGDDLKEQAEAQKAKSSAHLGEFGRVLERIETYRLPVIDLQLLAQQRRPGEAQRLASQEAQHPPCKEIRLRTQSSCPPSR